jgi:hypothetical protein
MYIEFNNHPNLLPLYEFNYRDNTNTSCHRSYRCPPPHIITTTPLHAQPLLNTGAPCFTLVTGSCFTSRRRPPQRRFPLHILHWQPCPSSLIHPYPSPLTRYIPTLSLYLTASPDSTSSRQRGAGAMQHVSSLGTHQRWYQPLTLAYTAKPQTLQPILRLPSPQHRYHYTIPPNTGANHAHHKTLVESIPQL